MAEQKDAFTLWCDKHLGPRDAREREVARRAYFAAAGGNGAVMAEQDVRRYTLRQEWPSRPTPRHRYYLDGCHAVGSMEGVQLVQAEDYDATKQERDQLAQENARLKAIELATTKLLFDNGGPVGGDTYFDIPDEFVLVKIELFQQLEAMLKGTVDA